MKDSDWGKLVGKVDKSNMLGLILDFHKQCKDAVERASALKLPPEYAKAKRIVVAGLGGSAIGGDLLFTYLAEELGIPLHVSRDYQLPAFVDKETLFFAVSYSGNTEETLSAYSEAVSRSAKIVGITSGGELKKRCKDMGKPVILVPGGMPPRTALGYLFFPMLVTLEQLKMVTDKSGEIRETITLLKELSEKYHSFPDNSATALVKKLYGRIPIIYGSRNNSAVALRWRTQINENSKTLAFHHLFPEMNHNEIVGWEKLEQITQNFRVVILRDKGESPRVKTRIEITKSIIGDVPSGIDEVSSEGESLLARLFSLICLGDFVSFYLAVISGVDPTPVERIDTLKKRLAQE
jgi:glucose/mannose-6-phosphate isomerase